ncbi:MAG TPA: hypothetical protein VGD36_16500 [Xanthobacteraceae bacterium]|jgi:hypothetical protein
MTLAEQFLHNARACEDLATQSRVAADRELWLRLAERWMTLMREASSFQTSGASRGKAGEA